MDTKQRRFRDLLGNNAGDALKVQTPSAPRVVGTFCTSCTSCTLRGRCNPLLLSQVPSSPALEVPVPRWCLGGAFSPTRLPPCPTVPLRFPSPDLSRSPGPQLLLPAVPASKWTRSSLWPPQPHGPVQMSCTPPSPVAPCLPGSNKPQPCSASPVPAHQSHPPSLARSSPFFHPPHHTIHIG